MRPLAGTQPPLAIRRLPRPIAKKTELFLWLVSSLAMGWVCSTRH
jgi:hypothetical protein